MLNTIEVVKEKSNRRILWVDVLRIFAIIGVIVLHAAAPVMYAFGTISTKYWMAANLFDSLTRASVPLFVMISGMMLLNTSRKDSLKVFFTKRFRKVLIPFLFWGTVYLLWKTYTLHQEMPFSRIAKEFITGPIYYHFWFVYMILGLYMVTPIFHKYVKSADEQNLLYFIAIWFTCSSLFPFAKKFFNIGIGLQLPMMTGYIGYFVLGYSLKHFTFSRKLLWPASACLAAGILTTFLGTYYLSVIAGKGFDEYFYDYMSPNVVFMAIGLFVLFMNVPLDFISENKSGFFGKAIETLSEASFGVYLVHVLVLEFLEKGFFGIKISGLSYNPLISIPVTSIAVILISFSVAILLKRIPVLKQII